MKNGFFEKDWKVYLTLLLLSFGYYYFYYNQLLLNLNSVLFQPNGDSLKNYYTYLYHIKNDASLFQFSGMNYPFGEHMVYTDCQPLLTFIIKLLPVTQPYAIGIMHALILISFIITPLILYRVFLYFDVNRLLAFLASLAIAMLSPQIHRIGGHFGMAYGCAIPLSMLFLMQYFRTPGIKQILILFVYNSCLFLMHPYLGLGGAGFTLLAILANGILNRKNPAGKNFLTKALVAGALPAILFNLFLMLTDTHTDRTPEPYGIDIMQAAANLESVFTPSFGPFDLFLKKFIHSEHVEWEALSYTGIFSLFMIIALLLGLPFYFKKINLSKELGALFIAALLLLVFAFGVHVQLLQALHIKITALNQFRCLGRYAWYFYFMFPVFFIGLLSGLSFKNTSAKNNFLIIAGLLFLGFNALEAHYFLTLVTKGNFEAKNCFDPALLSNNEKETLREIKSKNVQAILPAPIFHIGTDVYQRNGEVSFLPALLYSYHTGLPMLGEVLSRTSVKETETVLELFNRYKKNRQILKLLEGQNLLVIKTGNNQPEDEARMLRTLSPFKTYDDHEFSIATTANFIAAEKEINGFAAVAAKSDTARNLLYRRFENRKPFLPAKISDYEKIMLVDSNTVQQGEYTVSFRYYLPERMFRYIYNHLIVIKSNAAGYNNWEYFTTVRNGSGFYDGFVVFEYKINIDPHFKYEFVLNGSSKENYRISDFLLKPAALDVKMRIEHKNVYNNYPE